MIETYDSFMDLPLPGASAIIPQDGDDRLVPETFGLEWDSGVQNAGTRLFGAVAVTQVAPFFYFKPGYSGRPVKAMKRGLRKAGMLYVAPGKQPTGRHGPLSVKALNRFKREYHLPQNGVYDKATHTHLVPFMDHFALWMLEQERHERAQKQKPTKEELVRQAVLAAGMFLYNHRWQIPYSQYRPWHTTFIPRVPARLDCSGGTAWCYMNGGAPEPSGYPGWGYGNTWSQLSHARARGKITTVGKAKVGDNFQYDGHVAWKVGERDGHTRVWSMGHYPIEIYPYDYRHDLIAVCSML